MKKLAYLLLVFIMLQSQAISKVCYTCQEITPTKGNAFEKVTGVDFIENPQIAVAVVVENAGFGATWAAPVASMMMEQYLTGEVSRGDLRKRISSTVLNTNVINRK